MAAYAVNGGNLVGAMWVTLPTPTADSWVQARGDMYVTTETTPTLEGSFRIKALTPFPIKAGATGVRVRSAILDPIRVVMQDQP